MNITISHEIRSVDRLVIFYNVSIEDQSIVVFALRIIHTSISFHKKFT